MYVRNHMTKTEELVAKQREYFRSGVTLPCRFRCEMLDRLYHTIRMSESEIEAALQADLGKSRFEAYTTEVGFALSEISYLRRGGSAPTSPISPGGVRSSRSRTAMCW